MVCSVMIWNHPVLLTGSPVVPDGRAHTSMPTVTAVPVTPIEPETIAVRRCDPVVTMVVVGPTKTNLLKVAV